MLSSRTKKVNVYGRRGHRFITTQEDRPSITVRDELRADEESNAENGQENELERWDYALSSPLKSAAPKRIAPKHPKPRPYNPQKLRSTPARQPLAERRTNVPISPAKRMEKGRLKASISPQNRRTNVDIIIMDDGGKQLSEERRTIRDVNRATGDGKSTRAIAIPRNTITLKASPKRRAVRSALINLSDTEDDIDDSDDNYVPQLRRASIKPRSKVIIPDNSKSRGRLHKLDTRRMECSMEEQSSDDSLDVPLKPALAKISNRLITLSDSDSEGDQPAPEDIRKREGRTKQSHNANVRVSKDGYHMQERLQQTKYISKSSTGPEKRPETTFSSVLKTTVDKTSHHDVETSGQKLPRNTNSIPNRHHPKPSKEVLVISEDEYDESMSIDEELRLALELAEVELKDELVHDGAKHTIHLNLCGNHRQTARNVCKVHVDSHQKRTPACLRPLLSECGQLVPFEFAPFIETLPVDPIVSFSDVNFTAGQSCRTFAKVGEASYSEVFGIGNVVLKIIPLLDDESDASLTWTATHDPPPVSEVEDVLKEIMITRTMGEICKGFIKLLRAYVVQGSYPTSLLALWDGYNTKRGSESVRPDSFTEHQIYAVIVLPNGGPDLETFSFSKSADAKVSAWQQACSIFWQVTRCLAQAEELVHFEHRDLHWGQILVRGTHRSNLGFLSNARKQFMDDPSIGVKCTIIDLGLARINHGCGDAYWTPFEEEIFDGEGDYQYDVYRMMRKSKKDNWEAFQPLTNVMWLHYLADKLLNYKNIRSPSSTAITNRKSSANALSLTPLRENGKHAYDCLLEMETMLRQVLKPYAIISRKKSSKRKSAANSSRIELTIREPFEVKSATDVLQFGNAKGWIQ